MAAGSHRDGAANTLALDLVEASVLAGCQSAELTGVVTNLTRHGGAQVQIREPAIVATVDDPRAQLGQEVRLRVERADVARRHIELVVV
jgi:hypothetical protein